MLKKTILALFAALVLTASFGSGANANRCIDDEGVASAYAHDARC
jgi:hypothetical protein